MMPFQANLSYLPQNSKRKCKEGDWVCMRCNNYNYAFRDICNRCRYQTRLINEHALSLIGKENYGENSFPSALFLILEGPKQKEKEIPLTQLSSKSTFKQRPFKEMKITQENVVLNNRWINKLINQ